MLSRKFVAFTALATAALAGCSSAPKTEEAVALDRGCYVTGSNVPKKDCRGGPTTVLSPDPKALLDDARQAKPEVIK